MAAYIVQKIFFCVSCVEIINGAAIFLECLRLKLPILHSCCVHDCCALMHVIPHFNLLPVACFQRVCTVFLLLA